MDPEDASADTSADQVGATADDTVVFGDDVLEAVPFTQTNVS